MRLDYPRLAQVEKHAAEVLEGMQLRKLPIDPCFIAEQEGIELAPGEYGDDFFGRIEYHSREGGFILFHPDLANNRYPQVIRFSIGHELAHYYIPEHAALLQAGKFHNSTPGFVCDNAIEREADHFAGALLIPERAIKERCGRRGWMDMEAILKLADESVTSGTCAAIRYAKCAAEACIAVLSRSGSGEVICAVPSEEAQSVGCTWIERVPSTSITAKVGNFGGKTAVSSGQTTSDLWFSGRRNVFTLCEEAVPLGSTNLILTLLSVES